MHKIGLSTSGKTIDYNLFKNYKDAGIDYAEVSLPQELYVLPDYKFVKKVADDTGVHLWSYHLPFKPFDLIDISASDKEWRNRSVDYIAEIIKKAADIGIDKFILHSGGITKRKTAEEVEERLDCACESYARFAEIAAKEGGVICVENLPPVCVGKDIEEMKKLLSADSRLRLCFDTNHLLPGDGSEFIRAFADRLVTIHVSDYDLINERHWLPGEGKVNWQDIYKTLCSVGYNGPWLYEIRFENLTTITRERNLTCEDFVRNAKEIFENKEITLIPSVKNV